MKQNRRHSLGGITLLVVALVLLAGCQNSNPLAPYQPEIANNPDNFQLQATGVNHLTATLEYTWQNSGMRVSINQASVVTGGTAVLTLLDPGQVQRYSHDLSANGTFQSDTGTAGLWKVKVVLTGMSGTLNFRCQKL